MKKDYEIGLKFQLDLESEQRFMLLSLLSRTD